MGLFGIPTTTISGQAQSAAGLSVNINFYLLLDNSPSMNIAATSAGIQTDGLEHPGPGRLRIRLS